MLPEKKYLIRPGYVRSANDGQVHFISAGQLMRLYKVDPLECVVAGDFRPGGLGYDGLTELQPRRDGNYTLDG